VRVWRVSYPTQALYLEVHGRARLVTVLGGRDDFRRYEDAVAHIAHLQQIWPGCGCAGRSPWRKTAWSRREGGESGEEA